MKKFITVIMVLILLSSYTLSVSAASIETFGECGAGKKTFSPTVRIASYSTDVPRNVGALKYNKSVKINQVLPKSKGVPLYTSVRAMFAVATKDTRTIDFSVDTTKLPQKQSYYLVTSRDVSQTKYTYLDTDCNSVVTNWGNRYLYATPRKVQPGTDMNTYSGEKYQIGSLK